MPSTIRPGDVLADRYRLVDLLAESAGGRFWRAHDRVLERHVALHVMPADDDRAELLLEAARSSATVHDRRLLRVLDADRADGMVFVVNEWGSGDSLDIMLANEGPLGPRRAAWLVSEVAAAVAAGHELGVTHGRLVPENVLVDRTGGVRLIGFAVDAAMHGADPARPSADVTAIGGILYAALTGKWPGRDSAVPKAPVQQGRVLRPRQVRAGIPRPLDALCDEVVNPYTGSAGPSPREVHDLATAQGVADYLSDFVGDASGIAEAEAAGHREAPEVAMLPPIADPPVRRHGHHPDPEPDPEPEAAFEPPTEDPEREQDREPDGEPGREPDGADAGPDTEEDAGPTASELPTQAGLPIFDDVTDDVSWLTAPGEAAAPPPPFEEPPERPLFAPTPTGGGPARTPRHPAPEPQTHDRHLAHSSAGPQGRGYWPWDTGTGSIPPADDDAVEEVPGRSWLRLAGAIAAAVLLLLAVVVAYNLGRGRTPLGAVPDDQQSSTPRASQTPVSPAANPITGVTATDFDPEGSPAEENPDEVPFAIDGKPETAWKTMTYKQNFGPGGLKSGVGLILDLGSSRPVSAVDITVQGGSTGISLYLSDTRPTEVTDLTPVQTATVDQSQRIKLPKPTTGRYLTVWLTSIPAVTGGFRGAVAEITARG